MPNKKKVDAQPKAKAATQPQQWRERGGAASGTSSETVGGTGGSVAGKRVAPAAPQWRVKPATAQASDCAVHAAQAPASAAGEDSQVGSRGRADVSMMHSFIPPGCDATAGEEDEEGPSVRCYEDSMAKGFWIPPRLKGRNESLIEAVNDWHYAMLNDSHRNQFYWDAMKDVVKGKRVIDIGAGSGLLSLMASRQGASQVIAIEGSKDMVALAKLNVQRNGCDNIHVLHSLSSNVKLKEKEKAEVIVSETLGVLMLGEGTLDYLSDARRRLALPGCTVIPAGGAQYAMLICSPSLAMVSSVQAECCKGFDLSAIGSLQDTGNLFFTKQWGFRLNSIRDLAEMSERVCILEVDFQSTERADIPATKTFVLEAPRDGIIHAVVTSWEVWDTPERAHRITTHPEDTRDEPWGFARDMQWGQGLQLVEDFDLPQDRHSAPAPFHVKAGEKLLLTARFSVPCRQTFQFTLRRESAARGSSGPAKPAAA